MLPAFKMFMGGPIGTGNQWFSGIQDDVVAMMARPSWMPVPGFVLETMLGEGATVVLDGQQVLPKGLLDRREFLLPTGDKDAFQYGSLKKKMQNFSTRK